MISSDPERATRVKDLLMSCLRFTNPADPDGPLVTNSEHTDYRRPVAFEFPPDKPHSDGPNQVWNELCSLNYCTSDLAYTQAALDNTTAQVRALIDGWGDAAVLVAAVRWLADQDHECPEC